MSSKLPPGYTYELAVDEDGEVDRHFEDAASLLAKACDIGITSDRELAGLLLYKGKVAGAAWISADDEHYEFDVAVLPNHRGKGLGGYLVDRVLDIPYELTECYPDIKHSIHVINPQMEAMLRARGFVVSQPLPGGACIMEEDKALRQALKQGMDIHKLPVDTRSTQDPNLQSDIAPSTSHNVAGLRR